MFLLSFGSCSCSCLKIGSDVGSGSCLCSGSDFSSGSGSRLGSNEDSTSHLTLDLCAVLREMFRISQDYDLCPNECRC